VRLARLLSRLAVEVGIPGPEGITIHLGMDREELGLMAGMKRDTTIRALGRLKSEGIIKSGRTRITVTDEEALGSHLTEYLQNVS
jgi:CRP/FNR family transcriptional regulator